MAAAEPTASDKPIDQFIAESAARAAELRLTIPRLRAKLAEYDTLISQVQRRISNDERASRLTARGSTKRGNDGAEEQGSSKRGTEKMEVDDIYQLSKLSTDREYTDDALLRATHERRQLAAKCKKYKARADENAKTAKKTLEKAQHKAAAHDELDDELASMMGKLTVTPEVSHATAALEKASNDIFNMDELLRALGEGGYAKRKSYTRRRSKRSGKTMKKNRSGRRKPRKKTSKRRR